MQEWGGSNLYKVESKWTKIERKQPGGIGVRRKHHVE
jgi:hypothetical protein